MRFATKLPRPAGHGHRTVDPAAVLELLGGGAVLIDVREPADFGHGHAPQARNIPLDGLHARLPDLPRSRTLVLVCGSGFRSARAARILAREGFDAVSLAGGMRAWARAPLPVVATPVR